MSAKRKAVPKKSTRARPAAGKPFEDEVADAIEDMGIPVERNVVVGGRQKSFGFDVSHGFLGEEFLLWLWFQNETEGGEFQLGRHTVGVAIDDLLVFAPHSDDESEQTIRHGMPTRTAEARAGLRQGHRLAKAKLIVAMGSKTWTFVLDGTRMVCGSVKLPEDSAECEGSEDRTAERADSWFELHELVAKLFERFLASRLAPGWIKKEAAAIAAWMRS